MTTHPVEYDLYYSV